MLGRRRSGEVREKKSWPLQRTGYVSLYVDAATPSRRTATSHSAGCASRTASWTRNAQRRSSRGCSWTAVNIRRFVLSAARLYGLVELDTVTSQEAAFIAASVCARA
jgi:hypothetical protein